jgi:hypothetical protein
MVSKGGRGLEDILVKRVNLGNVSVHSTEVEMCKKTARCSHPEACRGELARRTAV